MEELQGTDRQVAFGVCAGLESQLACRSVLAGWNPGRVFVDDRSAPTAAFVLTAEGGCLAGDPAADRLVVGLDQLFAGTGELRYSQVPFFVDSDAWLPVLQQLSSGGKVACIPRRTYLCREVTMDWRERVPPEAATGVVDAEGLAGDRFDLPPHLQRWIRSNWGTSEALLAKGFGVVSRYSDIVVSWSLCDCVWEDACEIGIHTHPEWRRQGLAAITAAAATEHALASGCSVVGWHCNEENVGSAKTAERVGYTLERTHKMYFVCA